MRHQTSLAAALAIALLPAACGTQTAESAEPATTAAAAADVTSTTTAPTTTTAAPAAGDSNFEVLADKVIYHEDEAGTWEMSIFYPDAEGPWPLVVVYHGMTTAAAQPEARAIANMGAVAIAPQWLKEIAPVITRAEYVDGMLFDRAACAVGKAQQLASDYGGDPRQTTVSGFSAGIHPAAWVGLGVIRNDLCEVSPLHLPTGVVLGDSQFLFFEEGWDELIADPDLSPAADTLDRYVNPERWNMHIDVGVYLWTSNTRYGRDIENPPGVDSWIHARDTTGTLSDDLMVLGAFDDEFIDWMDNGLLMEMRMKAAGIDVAHEAVGGGHNYSTTVFDAIETLITR